MKKLIYIIIIIIIIGGVWAWTQSKNKTVQETVIPEIPTNKVSCEKQGGNWIVGSAEYGSKCISPYLDAGKKCASSDQCQGSCVTNTISQLGKEGECQKTNSIQGCFNAIENERFGCLSDDMMFSCDDKLWQSPCDRYEEQGLLVR